MGDISRICLRKFCHRPFIRPHLTSRKEWFHSPNIDAVFSLRNTSTIWILGSILVDSRDLDFLKCESLKAHYRIAG